MAAITASSSTATLPFSAASSSLYVGDLHPDVTDEQLLDAFSEFESLGSVRVCRDTATGKSLCYGYVNFVSPLDAAMAIKVKNHSKLNGNAMRVMWSRQDPDARKSGIGNLFVKNLDDSIDNVALEETFQKFGKILSCKIVETEEGESKGYGFVQYESDESANAAIEKLNGSTIGGKQMYALLSSICRKFVKKTDRVLPGPYTNVFVKNLDPNVTEEHLLENFSMFGEIVGLTISKDDNGSSRGFGFVNFKRSDDARQAIEAMDGFQLGSKVIYVAKAQDKAEREQIMQNQLEAKQNEQSLKSQGSNLYIKNINEIVGEDELQELFGKCGKITSLKLMRFDNGISKGFGFVCFSNPEDARKALSMFRGHILHNKPLYVAIAQKKKEREAQLQLQYAQQSLAPIAAPVCTPGRYHHGFYTVPPVAVSQLSPRPGLVYQPLAVRPSWRGNSYVAPFTPGFQYSQVHAIPHNPEISGRMNWPTQLYVPYTPQATKSGMTQSSSIKDSRNQQRSGQSKYVPPQGRVVAKKPSQSLPLPPRQVNCERMTEMLRKLLKVATPEEQRTLFGEQLYPAVNKLKPELSAKITGMIMEMDSEELLRLLDSPEGLAAKVEKAVEVLKLAKQAKENEPPQSSFQSNEVPWN